MTEIIEYPYWKLSNNNCPKCNKKTNILIDFNLDKEEEIDIGEYCSNCLWFVRLTDNWDK